MLFLIICAASLLSALVLVTSVSVQLFPADLLFDVPSSCMAVCTSVQAGS